MESAGENNIVRVVLSDRRAIGDMTFIIEQDDRLYVAIAVLEYDPAAAKTDEQKRGIAEVRAMYEDAKGKCCLCATMMMQTFSAKPVNTRPS